MSKQTEPRFPNAHLYINLDGPDGNAFAIMGKVSKLIRAHGGNQTDAYEYQHQATAGDYENLLTVTRQWIYLHTGAR